MISTSFTHLAARFLCVFAAVFLLSAAAQANPKYASIIMDYQTGKVLHSSSADAQRYPASLTKMMTLYMVFEQLDKGNMTLDQPLTVSPRAAGMPPSKLGLRAGETIRLKDAIGVLVTRSANDVAVVIAESISGTEWDFAQQMTRKAQQLGLRNTTFRNASGLPDRGQITTARDMAYLSKALLDHFPHHYKYFSTQQYSYRGQTINSTNKLLKRYDGVDGIKTGYINASGFNLAASAVRNGRRIIAVVFGGRTSRTRDDHMVTLLNRGFDKAKQLRVANQITPTGPAAPKPIQLASAVASTQAADRDNKSTSSGLSLISKAEASTGDATYAEGDASTSGIWAIQVGAFRSSQSAQDMAGKAAERIRGLSLEHVAVSSTQGTKGALYRARLIGLAENQAKGACKSLSSEGMDCLVVNPSGG
ncbi:D-alanyl-D-alanine carboxypeptidase [Fodinicurvata sediminis]|uniref:D-alanyl-D-alanine carboxypeptidase n=1 Tax=Fodinicurvata sediminis TaxID=1121832 RepID=UPI0003B424B2|nr:D-alanyl-D-alanine carboxypeptidase [Fodinicurvata sediminis]